MIETGLPVDVEIRHAHLFCGLGGGKKGFNRGKARVGNLRARFRCIGGIDVDPAAIADFNRMGPGRGTVLDLFDREQYKAWHGKEPPPGWREAVPADILRALGNELPDIWFMSAPCKGFSGLLSESRSLSAKYQALNKLTLRGAWLLLEAQKDNPAAFIIFENVPRIATRGRWLLDQIIALLKAYGYAVAETSHDCGELGNLAQSRKRFLLVARHIEKVPPFLYEPPKRPLRAVGEVLGKMPLPADPVAGPMHRVPALQWKTWVRLAFVEAGSDWRSLNRLAVEDGKLRDYLLVPEMFRGSFGVTAWNEPGPTITSKRQPSSGSFSVADPRAEVFKAGYGVNRWEDNVGAIAGESFPSNGGFSIADPRIDGHPKSVQIGVRKWDQAAGVVTGKMFVGGGPNAVADPRFNPGKFDGGQYGVTAWSDASVTIRTGRSPGQGEFSVADPRYKDGPSGPHFANVYRVVKWDRPSPVVTTGGTPSSSGVSVADPRPPEGPLFSKYAVTKWDQRTGTVIGGDDTGAYAVSDPRPPLVENYKQTKYRITGFDESTGAVIAASGTGNGAFAVADPRPACIKNKGDQYATGGHYGVIPWSTTGYAVTSHARWDNGFWSVADPRPLPEASERLVCVIRSLDGTWHRPFTTLELAALQSLIDPEEYLELEGLSDSAWRERIGNAVPPDAAEAIASVMAETILLARSGETFQLSAAPIWVRKIAIAVSVRPI